MLVLPSDLAVALACEPALVPILADRPLSAPAAEVAAAPPASIEIEVDGAIVRAPANLDTTALTAVLRAVRASASRR